MGDARAALEAVTEDVREAGSASHVGGVAPDLVARPTSTEQVAEVMRAAAEHGLSVVPRGRGTKMTWGRPPERVDLVVDVSGMEQVLDHAAGDLIVETQAGARLFDVQQAVGSARQRLALDETVPGSSIGGTLATAASGPRRMATGTMRDLLIGLTVVRADGVVAKAGGRVVKNVAGYDLGKLVHGSFGTLAVVTEAVFRLHPVPAARSFVSVPVEDAAEAGRVAQAVVHSQVVPSAVEVEWPGQASAPGPGSVTVLLEGTAKGVRGRTVTTQGLLGDGATVSEEAPDGWARYPWGEGATGLKLTFALSGLGAVLGDARSGTVPVHLRGSTGVGVLYGALPPGTEPQAVRETVDRLRAVCSSYGGSLVVVDAPAEVKAAVDVWGPIPALDLMRRVKDQFDPDHRLAPGRYVGGI
jgi:glycolate oxidase FAD binding subunit